MSQNAVFAAGCFWGVEEIFAGIDGVLKTEVGYVGGETEKPSYEQVKTGQTGHAEAVRLEFDPEKVSYKELLEYFWRLHDPTTLNRQGPDTGTQYRSAVFFENEEQKAVAESFLAELQGSGRFQAPIVTQIVPLTDFYRAEEYHQEYLKRNGGHSCHYLRDW